VPPPSARCAFVVVGWSGPEVLAGTVGKLLGVAERSDTVVFVDNARRRETRAWAEGLADPRLRYLDPGENLGFAGAANAGLAALDAASLDWAVIMSDDAVLEARFRRTLDEVAADATVGILGPVPRRLSDSSPYFVSRAFDLRRCVSRTVKPAPGRFAPTDYVEGRCLAIHAPLLASVGAFDEAFFIWLEDVDYCLRASRAGFKVLVDTESSVFDAEKSGAPSRFKVYLNARNRAYFALKHGSALDAAFALCTIGVVDAARQFAAPAPGGGRDTQSGADLVLACLDGVRLRLRKPASPREAAFARVNRGSKQA
jgi:GT2 family glycosyltransferase